ncbi:hypothetical protein BH11VER1_BH11VER1_06260 [soil metagenome]
MKHLFSNIILLINVNISSFLACSLFSHGLFAADKFLDPQFGYRKTSDIAYTTNYNYKLDLFEPTGANLPPLRPGFIVLHGYGGDKTTDKIVKICQNYTKRGYVCASINYAYPDGNSAAEAVRWMRNNASTYHIEPSRIAIGGSSAGATTSMFAAYREKNQVGLNAQVGVVLDLWGTMLGQDSIVDADDPPVFIVHGTADTTVPISASYSLINRLQLVNVDYRFFPIQGAGHSCFDNFWNDVVEGKTVDRHCAEFFYRHLDLQDIKATSAGPGRADWLTANFGTSVPAGLAAWNSDPDSDGAVNLVEYALGTSPVSGTSFPSQFDSVTPTLPRTLLFSFFRARPDVTYEVQSSNDLATWSVIAINPGSVGSVVTVSDGVDVSAQSRRFLRLQVTLEP